MKYLLRFFQRLYFVYAFLIFALVILLMFPFVAVASLWGKIKGGNTINRICEIAVDVVFPLIFISHRRIEVAPHDKSKPYIFVINHESYGDALYLLKAIRQPVRILAKAEMMNIPIFGFIYKTMVVPVYRSNVEHRAQSIRIIKSLVNKKISVIIFPEGTFNHTANPLKEFYNGAFRIAIETQTPIKPVLFLDTFARLPNALWNLNPGKCRAVFLDEIPVDGLTIGNVHELKQKTHQLMSEKLREYHASWIREAQETF